MVDRLLPPPEPESGAEPRSVRVVSFGYRHAAPPAAHLTVDVRDCLHNPAADPAMRQDTGLSLRVRLHVLETPGAEGLLAGLLTTTVVLWRRMATRGLPVVVAIGCAGGRHRSVALAEYLTRDLLSGGVPAETVHRDIDRPVLGGGHR